MSNDFGKLLDPPEDLLGMLLDLPLGDEFLLLGSARLELTLAQEEPMGVHCLLLSGRLKEALTQLSH
jgi:hypothetical protein